VSATPSNIQKVVLKLGTGLLTSGQEPFFDQQRVSRLAREVHQLKSAGKQVILVSSGAIGLGMKQLGLSTRPRQLAELQACAAIGQPVLMRCWREAFEQVGLRVAQVLLTREDIGSRTRHLNILGMLKALLEKGIVPIINENDSISTAEIRFGDNDILGALVASLLKADLYVILSSIPGLLDRANGDRLIEIVPEITSEIEALAGGTDSETAVGGMISKLNAARVGQFSGVTVAITDGRAEGCVSQLLQPEFRGTLFLPRSGGLRSRQRWLAFFDRPLGVLVVDEGASKAILRSGRSLLARGLVRVEGDFSAKSLVEIRSETGQVLARGLARYSSADCGRILGLSSDDIAVIFPQERRFEVVHRDDLVILA
jgi:glutamate 5-kinase